MGDGEADSKETSVKTNRLKGMKIRDEFICPITYELMREPVVASDGHTYEKSAIEKWLKTSRVSPRNGETIQAFTIPNFNVRKMIQDIINEGGSAFYVTDMNNKDRLFDVLPEKILVLECLGPPESEWNQQSFQVNRHGCVGGRKHQADEAYQNKEIVLFKDITVSRKHFEINQTIGPSGTIDFYLRDLGSAGGTFIRIPHGKKKKLQPGMIILLGKHQFTVSKIDDDSRPHSANRGKRNDPWRSSNLDSNTILSLVENAEKIISEFSNDSVQAENRSELSARLKQLTSELSSHLSIDDESVSKNEEKRKNDFKRINDNEPRENGEYGAQAKEAFASRQLAGTTKTTGDSMVLAEQMSDSKDDRGSETPPPEHQDFSSRSCLLTCCAPDGSPLQRRDFLVSSDGASIGRKQTNEIALYIKLEDNGEERIVNVDTAISSEHARIEFDHETGDFFIMDGTETKPSTNGTWIRLSGPHQESAPYLLSGGAEILIGTVRFQVRESMTITEHKVETKFGSDDK